MIKILPEQFENILPLAVEWAEAKEKVILEHGTALSPQYMEDAKSVDVKYPDRVRIYEVPQIPIPKHPILKAAAEATQLISTETIGISLGYGIFIHNNFFKMTAVPLSMNWFTLCSARSLADYIRFRKNICGSASRLDIQKPRWSRRQSGSRVKYVGNDKIKK